MQKDLFGNDVKQASLDITEQYIKDRDEVMFIQRSNRLKYLHKINPSGITLAGQAELVLTYRELQLCFIDGHTLATIVLGQAFVEKVLHHYYNQIGLTEIAKKGLNAILQHAIKNKTLNPYVIKKVDKIRLIRNPITHLKENDYKHSLDNRSYNSKTSPMNQLEKDAKEAIEIATFIAVTDLTPLSR